MSNTEHIIERCWKSESTFSSLCEFFKNKIPTWCHLLFYFTSYVLNMFRTLIYLSSGACDYSVELPHWSYCSWFDVCWSFGVSGLEWYPCCRLKHNNTDTTPTQPHQNSNTHRTKNNTTNVAIQQNSRKLLMIDILMSETCWAHKKWNKIAIDIKFIFYSSTLSSVVEFGESRFSAILSPFVRRKYEASVLNPASSYQHSHIYFLFVTRKFSATHPRPQALTTFVLKI